MRKLIEVKCIGRGGQGAVTFAQLLAIASFYEGNHVQAMPMFGVERRGAPSMSFTRISNKKILIRSQIYEPDFIVVLDDSLLGIKDILNGLKKTGSVIVNSRSERNLKAKACFVDATSIALKIFGRNIVNTPMLGAFAAYTNIVSLKNIFKAIDERFDDPLLRKKNKQAVKETYNLCLKKK